MDECKPLISCPCTHPAHTATPSPPVPATSTTTTQMGEISTERQKGEKLTDRHQSEKGSVAINVAISDWVNMYPSDHFLRVDFVGPRKVGRYTLTVSESVYKAPMCFQRLKLQCAVERLSISTCDATPRWLLAAMASATTPSASSTVRQGLTLVHCSA